MPPLPLFELFQALRQPLSLQPEQYTLLLEAMDLGFGTKGIEDIREICRLLWLKSWGTWEETHFEEVFAQYIKQSVSTISVGNEVTEETSSKSQSESITQDKTPIAPLPSPPKGLPTPPALTPLPSPPKGLPTPSALTPLPKQSPEFFQLLSAYQTAPPSENTQSQGGYLVKMRDFPFLERQMHHVWLRLRQPMRRGRATEIDISGTIQLASRQLVVWEPLRQPPRTNQTKFLFLIDCDGSMVPFRPIVERLINTIETNRFAQVNCYYFRNCPRDFVYLKKKGSEIRYIEDLPFNPQTTIVLIISDAGAARGGYNTQRIAMTRDFLDKIQSRVNRLVWLNPLPEFRWVQTTAEAINHLIEGQMFEIPQRGIVAAIRCVSNRSSYG